MSLPHPRLASCSSLALALTLGWARSAALCLLLATGCFAYRDGKLPRGGGFSAGERGTKTIAVSVKAERKVRGLMGDFPEPLRESWIEATLQAYRDCGVFSDVRRGIGGDTDLRASIEIEDNVEASRPFTYLSAMSFFLLPSRSRDELSVRTTYRDRSGEVVGDFRSREAVVTWFQLFLLPLTPFADRDSVVEKTLRDLTLATTRRARNKGVF